MGKMKIKLSNNYHFVIPKRYVDRKLRRLCYASIKIRKLRRVEEFIVKLLHRAHGPIEVVMPKFVRNKLQLKIGDVFELLEIRNIKRPKPPSQLIRNGNVDLLFLLPRKMSNGKEIIVDYDHDYIRLWSLKCQELRLKRFVKIDKLGKFFGLMQAESAKSGNKFDFINIFYNLHKEFLFLLNSLCNIANLEFKCYLQYNPRTTSRKEAEKSAIEFLKTTRLSSELKFVKNHGVGRVPPVDLCVFSKLLNEVFLGMLNNLRHYLSYKKLDKDEKALAEFFVSKILTGDGTIKVRKREGHFTPYIKIFDLVPSLEDYKKILSNLGIGSRIDENEFELRLLCNWDTAVYLYKIGAFDGHDTNRRKLLDALTNHSKTKSLGKLSLFKAIPLTLSQIIKAPNTKQSTNYWLNNRISEGYLKKAQNKYLLTKKGYDVLNFIKNLNKKVN
jgi:bifunctional DNA-binding transcriptional regulator/antitoxin component of YhaV-PrlF toxin-antitoxin module